MTTMVRLFNLHLEHCADAAEKIVLGFDCVRPCKDKSERIHCVAGAGQE